jgi:hydroxymethylbilane synthase
MSSKITIATRESRLALWQAHHVKQLLEAQGHEVSLLGMTTPVSYTHLRAHETN